MKRWFFIASLILALAPAGLNAADSVWVNDAVITVPPAIAPQIDAVSVVNNGTMSLLFTNADYLPLFDTTSTLNFTNTFNGYMACNLGFRFDTAPASFGLRQRSANFENDGFIVSGITGINATNATDILSLGSLILGTGAARSFVNANNIVSPGTFALAFESLLRFDGASVDLSRGNIAMDSSGFLIGLGIFNFFTVNQGFFDGYWGLGVDFMNPFFQFEVPPPVSVPEIVTDRHNNLLIQQLGGPNFISYVRSDTIDVSNVINRAVFINNTNAGFDVNVYFRNDFSPFGLGDISVEWISTLTNASFAKTNYLYVFDQLLDPPFPPNPLVPVLLQNGSVGLGLLPTFKPDTYNFLQTGVQFGQGVPATPPGPIPPGTFPNTLVTNDWTAYEAIFAATTRNLTDVVGQNVTNLPGRVEVNAEKYLDLGYSRIASDNYLLLQATNQFAGNAGSIIFSPYTDLNLRHTNGVFAISNLAQPFVPKPEGTIELYSARFTNVVVDANGNFVSNAFHVLFVDANLAPAVISRQQDVTLRSVNANGGDDNLIISDILTVTRSFLLDSERITVTTNGPGANTAEGGIQLTDPNIVWTTSAPRLQYLTNNGFISTENAVFFGGSRRSPVDSTLQQFPYQVFINSGTITNTASVISAKLFENGGIFNALLGSISLGQAQAAILTNGAFLAPNGAISIQGNGLLISNHVFQAGGPITLSPSVSLDDGTFAAGCPEFNTNKNFWVGSGLNLMVAPGLGTLASTTVSNFAAPFRNIVNRWAAADRGASPAGFDNNNTPVGHLILSGGQNSMFTFSAASGGNAIYIDRLDLENFTTNYIGNDLLGISIDPNMKVYYGQAFAGGVSVAEKIDGYEGGRLVWVKDYNCGFFSSTNVVYADGSTNRVNAALAMSCNIDSDGDGQVNCVDPSPIPTNGLSVCSCNPVNISLPVILSAGGGGGSGPGSGSSSGSGSKLDFPIVPGNGSNSVALASASFSGLYYESNGVAAPSAGYFSAVVNAKGTYTGKINSGGGTYTFSGKIDPVTSKSSARVSRGVLHALTLNLQLDSAAKQLRGTVSDGNWTANLVADKLTFSKSARANQAGTYTLVVPSAPEDTNSPAGFSIGTVNVDAGGNVTWSGALADGSKVTQKSTLSAEGIWPLYSSLYSGKGLVLGWIQVTNDNVGGDLIWIKPSGVSGNYYPGGFTNLINSIGSPYHKPAAKARVLDWNDGLGQFSISGGGLSQTWTNDIRLDLNNRVTSVSGPKLSLSITTASGLFRGTFVDPETQKAELFQGVLFQDSNVGVGYFLGPDQSGEIRLGPAP
jgi:hypothetical protein